ncbi:MAG: hypothetical protein QF440_02365 [Candidatus Thalassarchaeaceae archaeon]|jgi:hypothetical protein|nr:hypothetical protein [Candidatus Thalassarchaeaceae archaeon]
MSESAFAYFIRHVSEIDFQYSWTGVSMIHAILSFITMIFLFTLASMIIRARPESSENRFMAMMLFVEGLKTIVAWYAIYPFGPEILPLVQYWRAIYYTLAFLSILMYLSLSSFYPVKFLSFMTKDKIKENLYWALPVIAIVVMTSLIVSSGGIYETFNGSQHVSCQEAGGDAVVTPSTGAEQYEAVCLDDPGTIPYEYVVVEQSGLGKLLLFAPTLAAFAALAFMRSAQKGLEHDGDGEESGNKATEARALAIGFGGKAFFQGLMVFFMVFITIKFGTFNTVDLITVGVNADLKFFFYGLYGFLFSVLFAGMFEGIMFTYAILKNEVLGIDERLRKTFSATIFATLGAVLLLVATELMENLTGFGTLGGIIIGLPLIVLRKPIYATINGFSSRLMPESFTKAEESYIEAYSMVMDDGILTENERKLLSLQAKNLGLNAARVEYLEEWYNSTQDVTEEE